MNWLLHAEWPATTKLSQRIVAIKQNVAGNQNQQRGNFQRLVKSIQRKLFVSASLDQRLHGSFVWMSAHVDSMSSVPKSMCMNRKLSMRPRFPRSTVPRNPFSPVCVPPFCARFRSCWIDITVQHFVRDGLFFPSLRHKKLSGRVVQLSKRGEQVASRTFLNNTSKD